MEREEHVRNKKSLRRIIRKSGFTGLFYSSGIFTIQPYNRILRDSQSKICAEDNKRTNSTR